MTSETNILMGGFNSSSDSAEISPMSLNRGRRSEPVFLNLVGDVTVPPFAGFSSDSFVWHVRLFVAFLGQIP